MVSSKKSIPDILSADPNTMGNKALSEIRVEISPLSMGSSAKKSSKNASFTSANFSSSSCFD